MRYWGKKWYFRTILGQRAFLSYFLHVLAAEKSKSWFLNNCAANILVFFLGLKLVIGRCHIKFWAIEMACLVGRLSDLCHFEKISKVTGLWRKFTQIGIAYELYKALKRPTKQPITTPQNLIWHPTRTNFGPQKKTKYLQHSYLEIWILIFRVWIHEENGSKRCLSSIGTKIPHFTPISHLKPSYINSFVFKSPIQIP